MRRIDTASCGSLYFHMMTLTEVGDSIPTHRHTYDHVLQVQQGKVRLWSERDGAEEIAAPAVKLIPAGVAHELEAVEPNTVCCCIHLMKDEQGHEYPFAYEPSDREFAEATARM